MSQREKGAAFRALHEGEPFLIPNPWDAGSARVLEGLGFRALATTSSGFAFTLGRPDGSVTLDEVADHVAALAGATELPISVDLENGYGDASRGHPPRRRGGRRRRVDRGLRALGLAPPESVRRRSAWPPRPRRRARSASRSCSRRAPRTTSAAIPTSTTRSRASARMRTRAPTACTRRGCGRSSRSARCATRSTCPVNVLAWPGLTVAEIFGAGAQRISVGGRFAWVAVGALAAAAEEMRDHGTFADAKGDWLS